MNEFVAQVLRIEGIAQVVHLNKRTVRNLYEADRLSKQEVLVLADSTTVVLAMSNGHHFLLDQSSPFLSQYHSVFMEDLVLASDHHDEIPQESQRESVPETISKLLEESYISSNIKASLEGWVSSAIEPGEALSRNTVNVDAVNDFRGLTLPIPFDDPKTEVPTQDILGEVALNLSGLDQVSEGSVANYTLSLSKPPVTPLTVVLSVGNVETDDKDYDAPTLSVIFAPNQTVATFGIEVQLDKVVEGEERFQVSVIQTQGGGFEQSPILPSSMLTTITGEGTAASRSLLPELMESESMDAYFSYIQGSQDGSVSKLMISSGYAANDTETVQFLVNEMTTNEWLEVDVASME